MHLSYVRVLVDRFAEAFRFYRDVMGFEVIMGDGCDIYAEYRVGPATRLALVARQVIAAVPGVGAEAGPAAPERFMLVFETDDVDKQAAALKGCGVTLVAEPADRPDWSVRTAHLRDPEGNLIEINTPMRK